MVTKWAEDLIRRDEEHIIHPYASAVGHNRVRFTP